MMDYKVICMDNAERFEYEVRNMLRDGWELLGGVSISFDGGGDK